MGSSLWKEAMISWKRCLCREGSGIFRMSFTMSTLLMVSDRDFSKHDIILAYSLAINFFYPQPISSVYTILNKAIESAYINTPACFTITPRNTFAICISTEFASILMSILSFMNNLNKDFYTRDKSLLVGISLILSRTSPNQS